MLELACKVGDSLLLIKRKGSQVVMVEAQSQNIVLGKMSKENCPGFETSSAVKELPKRKRSPAKTIKEVRKSTKSHRDGKNIS